jgi:acyl-CoA synthetase (NDP forming)
MVGLPDAIASLADDPRVSVIALHVEGIADPGGFADAVASARARGKPVIAMKVGRSAAASELTMSHTASLAGGDAVADAFLRRLGVGRVTSIPEFLETAKLLHVFGPIPERGLVTMSCSGGEASVMADAADLAGVPMPAFACADVARIQPTVNPIVSVSNPFDYHTFDWGNGPRLSETFTAVMDGTQALTALVLDFPRTELGAAPGWDVALSAFCDASTTNGARAALLSTLPENLPEDRAEALLDAGVAPMQGVAEMMTALRVAFDLSREAQPFSPIVARVPCGAVRALSEAEAKSRLAAHGLRVPDGRLCVSEDEALAAQAMLGRCAFKACGPDIAHKTELGAVILNVEDAQSAHAAFGRLRSLGEAVLVEKMIPKPLAEMILGVARDAAMGLHLLVGAGGVLAELVRDTRILIPPFTRAHVLAELKGLKLFVLLDGWRGGPRADLTAIVDAVMALQDFVVENADRVTEVDINPLMVGADFAVAADALIRMSEEPAR